MWNQMVPACGAAVPHGSCSLDALYLCSHGSICLSETHFQWYTADLHWLGWIVQGESQRAARYCEGLFLAQAKARLWNIQYNIPKWNVWFQGMPKDIFCIGQVEKLLFPIVGLLVFFVGLVFLFIFLKFIPLEKYVLIKLFIPTNYNVFHGLDHPALFLANIRVQFHSRCKRSDSVSATPGVNPMISDTINEFYPRCMKRYVSL